MLSKKVPCSDCGRMVYRSVSNLYDIKDDVYVYLCKSCRPSSFYYKVVYKKVKLRDMIVMA